MYIPLPLFPDLSIFHSFPGFMLEGGGSQVFTSVKATLKTDSMSLRRRDGIRLGGQRNAIPSGIRRAYTSSRKRRKYCVATNKNMYRVFREEFFSFLPPFSLRANIFLSIQDKKRTRKFRNRILLGKQPSSADFFSTRSVIQQILSRRVPFA